jgi:hypothetical protein
MEQHKLDLAVIDPPPAKSVWEITATGEEILLACVHHPPCSNPCHF